MRDYEYVEAMRSGDSQPDFMGGNPVPFTTQPGDNLERDIEGMFLGYLIVYTIRQIIRHHHYIAVLVLLASVVSFLLVLTQLDMTSDWAWMAFGLFITSLVSLAKCMS